MKQRLLRIAVVVAVLSTFFWLAGKFPEPPSGPAVDPPSARPSLPKPTAPLPEDPASPKTSRDSVAATPPELQQKIDPEPAPPAVRKNFENPLVPPSFPVAPPPRSAEAEPTAAADLDKVSLMLRDYRTITGENPVGTNAEIMKALMGDNPKGAKLGPPDGMALNGQGELVDSWGTPIFFHQLSKDHMELISAGPDQRMGTDDDLMLK